MKTYIVAALLLAVSGSTQAFECDQSCSLLVPVEETSIRYQITTNKLTYMPGSPVQVSLSAYNSSFPYKGIILQAKRMGDDSPVGSFNGASPQPEMVNCITDSDTICIKSDDMLQSVIAIWLSPEPAGTAKHVEFQALFLDFDDIVHRQHSVILSEFVPNVEVDPEVDLHDDRTEGEMDSVKRQQMQDTIDKENLATEDDMAKDEMTERQEHEAEVRWEETQYEIERKEEEDRRRARIQSEIRDKEEFDRIQFEKEEEARRQREREEAEREAREREEAERERKRQEEEDKKREENETFGKGPGEEIDLDDRKNSPVGGSPKMVAVSMVTIAASLLVMLL